jgi:RNase P/RNase MRP subunit p29
MNVIGQVLKIISSTDPTKVGRKGKVLLESAATLVIDSGGKTIRVEKLGLAFQLLDSGRVLTGEDVAGRLQDRLGRAAA